jgi:hypothetical protein
VAASAAAAATAAPTLQGLAMGTTAASQQQQQEQHPSRSLGATAATCSSTVLQWGVAAMALMRRATSSIAAAPQPQPGGHSSHLQPHRGGWRHGATALRFWGQMARAKAGLFCSPGSAGASVSSFPRPYRPSLAPSDPRTCCDVCGRDRVRTAYGAGFAGSVRTVRTRTGTYPYVRPNPAMRA